VKEVKEKKEKKEKRKATWFERRREKPFFREKPVLSLPKNGTKILDRFLFFSLHTN